MNGAELDRQVREIFDHATRETVFASAAALVELGFGGGQSFLMVCKVLEAKEQSDQPKANP